MSASTENGNQSPLPTSKLSAFLRHYAQPFTTLIDRHKTTQVHALHNNDDVVSKPTISSILSTSINNDAVSNLKQEALLPYGLPATDLIEPPVDPHLKPLDLLAALSAVRRRLDSRKDTDKSPVLLEQHAVLRGLGDPRLLRRCLRAAREHAPDLHFEVVLSSWLGYERREEVEEEDELVGVLPDVALASGYDSKSVLDCCRCHNGRIEPSTNVGILPNAALASGCDSKSVFDCCRCHNGRMEATNDLGMLTEEEDELVGILPDVASASGSVSKSVFDCHSCQNGKTEATNNVGVSIGESDVCFFIGEEEVYCVRERIAALSRPLEAMLYGGFIESKRDRIDFSEMAISAEGMRAVDVFSRTGRLDWFSPDVVLELLSFANRFCCEGMKTSCDETLACLVSNLDNALVLIDYGLEESVNLLVASCLRVLLRELPSSLYDSKVRRMFCSPEGRERLAMAGHCSFLLYDFLTQVALQERVNSDVTVALLERLKECATEKWQKEIGLHQLGCVLLERKEYKEAESCFEEAAEMGHVYSIVGVARTQYKQGKRYSAYKLIDSLISKYKPVGWMFQELSLYNVGTKKILDMNTATKLDPTLSFPYKYRAVAMVEESQIGQAISEINKVIGFKVSPDCLELRAWFFITLGDYEAALRDVRALLTLEPDYMMFGGKMRGDHLVELLSQRVRQWGPGDCWMQLYDRWSSVDDIGSLAVTHQMLVNDPRKSRLLFRQSLLLLRLNCQKAAMRCLRLARNHACSEHERLIYEGWILYDTGYREEALAKAELSISIQRSFEAFFLKAYTLADITLDSESSSHVIQLLEEALRCPSDSLRKGQALNNLGSIYVDCGRLELAADCYSKALDIKHTRAHQGLARVYHLKNQRKAAYDEMTKLIEKAQNKASAYEKRSEYCGREMANGDLSMATQLDPTRTYPYRFRAAVVMDDQRETEAVEELTKALAFKPDLQMLHLRAAFHESMGDFVSGLRDCEAALCLDPNHKDTLDLYNRIQGGAPNSPM